MERSRAKSLDGAPVLFDQIEAALTVKERSGIGEWRGRFWLPAGNRVEPGGKYFLLHDDGRAGGLIVDGFGPGPTGDMSKCSVATAIPSDKLEGCRPPQGVAGTRTLGSQAEVIGLMT